MERHGLSVSLLESMSSKVIAAGLGLASHLVFNRGEWDNKGHLLVGFYSTFLVAIFTLEHANDNSIVGALRESCLIGSAYFAALFTSIAIYRAFFHRLRRFPGPFLSRVSKLHSIYSIVPDLHLYRVVENLHKKYKSDIIRTGPRELSIATADAIPLVHGPASKCTKGPWYDNSKSIEGSSVQSTRIKAEHRERRRTWDHAFNAKALREYEPRVNRLTRLLMKQLHERSDEKIRISDWVNYYSFDVMGDVSFSRSFSMLERGVKDELVSTLHKSMKPFSVFQHIVWLVHVLLRIPGGADDLLNMAAWAQKVLIERKKITPEDPDVFGWLFDPSDDHISRELNADSRLVIIAGSDTTSAELTWLIYHLCADQKLQSDLRTALSATASSKSFLDADDLSSCPLLDGIIHETLRLHPAVPSGVQRESPPEGFTLPDGTFVPGETLIWMPIHTLNRDPRYFSLPLEFRPERWYAESDGKDETQARVLNKSAFMPFGFGAYNCVGQKLAIMEMRSVVANLVWGFDVEFAEGEDGKRVLEDTIDTFTLSMGALDVRLKPRKEAWT